MTIIKSIVQDININDEIERPNSMTTIIDKDENDEKKFIVYKCGKNVKPISKTEFTSCYNQLLQKKVLNREFYISKFGNSKPCNYTTIGSIFKRLRICNYIKPNYILTEDSLK